MKFEIVFPQKYFADADKIKVSLMGIQYSCFALGVYCLDTD